MRFTNKFSWLKSETLLLLCNKSTSLKSFDYHQTAGPYANYKERRGVPVQSSQVSERLNWILCIHIPKKEMATTNPMLLSLAFGTPIFFTIGRHTHPASPYQRCWTVESCTPLSPWEHTKTMDRFPKN